MVKLKIKLPEKISTNKIYSGVHWAVRKKWADLFHRSLLPYRNKITIKNYPVSVSYIYTFKGRQLDASNCSFMSKLFEDAMVQNKILIDDTPNFVDEIVLISQKGTSDEVEIIISETINE